MSSSYDGERRRTPLCLLGLHSWQVRNGADQVRYRACRRCNLVDDAAIGPIGF